MAELATANVVPFIVVIVGVVQGAYRLGPCRGRSPGTRAEDALPPKRRFAAEAFALLRQLRAEHEACAR
ncbi:hypothetical protein [Segniliparus rugosus]|uniref:hypothetical protein n=1 Tax=Segniliparus rugosus TaxID=286804 RepID=UPI0012EC5184|nr:hypothetical protein [Segniliparus rugosus]